MYLYASYCIYENELSKNISQFFPALSGSLVTKVRAQIGYWRKSYMIHAWFVKHVQEGVDNCDEYYVSKEELKELLETVNEVLGDHSKAPTLLKIPQSLFGTPSYDDGYFEDLEETKQIIEKALLLPEDWDITYQSSW